MKAILCKCTHPIEEHKRFEPEAARCTHEGCDCRHFTLPAHIPAKLWAYVGGAALLASLLLPARAQEPTLYKRELQPMPHIVRTDAGHHHEARVNCPVGYRVASAFDNKDWVSGSSADIEEALRKAVCREQTASEFKQTAEWMLSHHTYTDLLVMWGDEPTLEVKR